MTFGEKLVHYRTKKNLSQKALAEVLDITPTRLNYWEKDKREPDIAMVRHLATVLDVSANVLIGLEDDEDTNKSPAREVAEDEYYQRVVVSLTGLLRDLGLIGADGDITDEDRRFILSVAALLNTYFEDRR